MVRVIRTAYPVVLANAASEHVDVEAVADMPRPVTLAEIKDNPKLSNMSLVTCMRLSVQPVTADEWEEVCRMGGLDPRKLKA